MPEGFNFEKVFNEVNNESKKKAQQREGKLSMATEEEVDEENSDSFDESKKSFDDDQSEDTES
jgi:hypothetical protein